MYQKELKIAIQAVKKAESTFRKYFGTKTRVKMKQGNYLDLVSYADEKIERDIKKFLVKRFPNYGFIGEEKGKINEKAEFVWTVDPIDGTNNFLQGIPYCAISLALLKNMKPVVGVVSAPMLNMFYTANSKSKARLNGKVIKTSTSQKIKNAFGGLGWGRDIDFAVQMTPLIISKTRKLRIIGSAAYSICLVAAGVYDFYVQRQLSIWDYAAGQIILEEAGGKFVTLKTKKPIQIAANKILVKGLLNLFR